LHIIFPSEYYNFLTIMNNSERLLSLDVFRGATIAFMILVNNQGISGNAYGPLAHGGGYEVTPTDWVFPFFLFIVGVAMPFSFAKRLDKTNGGKKLIYKKVVVRALLLFAIGMLLNIYPKFNFGTWRIMGVLQRIALCYLFTALIVLNFKLKGQLIAIVILLLAYWALMAFVPYPGKGPDPWSWDNNFGRWLDKLILGPFMWRPNEVELKSLSGTLSATCNTLIGYQAGVCLYSQRQPLERTVRIFLGGTLLTVLGLFWVYWIPFSQNLWTPSFAVYTSGLGLLLLAVAYWWIDIRGHRKGLALFIHFGSNAIIAWCASQLFSSTLNWIKVPHGGESINLSMLIYDHGLLPHLGGANASLIYGLCHVLLWWAVLAFMYRRSWLVKI
jgi:predicted acyltransferase